MQLDAAAPRLGEERAAVARPTAEELAAAYLPRVHRFAVMVSPAGTDPDDVAQQAMLRAIERLPAFDPRRGTLDAWLWRIVVNLARDAGRAARRRDLVVERLRIAARAAPGSPEALTLDRLRDAELLAAVRRLPRRYRTLVALRYGADLSAAEIAAALGTTRMTVAKALRRALDRLRADLTEPEGLT